MSSGFVLLVVLGLVVFAVLLAPAETETGGNYSTQSSGPTGAKVAFDLARRLGWSSERRIIPFDTDTIRAPIQSLVAVSLGAAETHDILEYTRHGGSILVAGTDGDLGDSLHLTEGHTGLPAHDEIGDCPVGDPFDILIEGTRPIAPVRWTQPPPPDTVGFGSLGNSRRTDRAAYGFALGAGRVVVIGDPDFISNDVLRVCASGAGVGYVRMLEYLSGGRRGIRVAFDEFHHGAGIHGGSLTAIRLYMGSTASGRMLGQIAIGGLLLLIAAAPRPLSPQDPVRIARRSPLEHADALARAYSAVEATRIVTGQLLAGVRRRTRRGRTRSRETDEQFLASASTASPAAATAAEIVSRGLTQSLTPRELVDVAGALSTLEDVLASGPSTRKS